MKYIFLTLFLLTFSNATQTNAVQKSFECANELSKSHDYKKAVEIYDKLLQIVPDDTSIIYNKAYALKSWGHMHEAIPIYKDVLRLNPANSVAPYGLAQAYLSTGNFTDGWFMLQWRSANVEAWHPAMVNLKEAYAQDKQLFKNKSVLIRGEFGYGDTFQFIRYAQLLKQQGATVIVHTFGELVPLFSLCPYIDTVIPVGGKLLASPDFQIPLLSLPLVFDTQLDTIPADIPYLYAHDSLVEQWQDNLLADKNFKIGICWQGKIGHFLEDNPFTRRAVNLSLFAPIAAIEGVSLYSLQKVGGLDQLQDIPFTLHQFNENFDQQNGRFMDSAALIMKLDLMVSIDTSLVHLAAALGKPTWVLIPSVPEWRWLTERTDTPWYPKNMRLFRQQVHGDWEGVIQDVVVEIKKLLASKVLVDD